MSDTTRTRYWTQSGNAPNRGFPPHTRFAAPPPPEPYAVANQAHLSPPAPPPRAIDYGLACQQNRGPSPPYTAPSPVVAAPPYVYYSVQLVPYLVVPAQPPPPPPPPTSLHEGSTLDGAYVNFENGMSYVFPEKHTVICFSKTNKQPWKERDMRFEFTHRKVACNMTVKELIRQLGAPKGKDDKVGITEMYEVGDGSWLEGRTFVLSSDKSKQTLEQLGWDEHRGKKKKPVWFTMWTR